MYGQLPEICTLECGLKNCGKRNITCNMETVQTVKIQTHNGSTHSYCMYQTKRLESDMTQESLLQQCTLDSQRAKVHKGDENGGRD